MSDFHFIRRRGDRQSLSIGLEPLEHLIDDGWLQRTAGAKAAELPFHGRQVVEFGLEVRPTTTMGTWTWSPTWGASRILCPEDGGQHDPDAMPNDGNDRNNDYDCNDDIEHEHGPSTFSASLAFWPAATRRKHEEAAHLYKNRLATLPTITP